jgi:hypothetical protein
MVEDKNWLSLTDYSAKHKVSISTLRRRIKSDDIDYKIEGSKYLLLDNQKIPDSDNKSNYKNLNSVQPAHRPSQRNEWVAGSDKKELKNDSVLNAANEIVNELKNAYSSILQEKEEQIVKLKTHIAELETLISVLEQNHRTNS